MLKYKMENRVLFTNRLHYGVIFIPMYILKKKNSIRFLVRFYDYGLPDCWLYPQAVYSFNSAQNTIPGILNMTEQLQQTELTNI